MSFPINKLEDYLSDLECAVQDAREAFDDSNPDDTVAELDNARDLCQAALDLLQGIEDVQEASMHNDFGGVKI